MGWKPSRLATLISTPLSAAVRGLDERASEVDQGADVQRDHVLQTIRVLVGERVVGAETGVVHQPGGVDTARLQLGAKGAAGVGQTEIAGNSGHRDAVGAGQLVGQTLEPVRATGDEHEVRAPGGELAGELGAET